MARGKVRRGSTWVDMTAMCDVAFLLLTFFILVGKFKPSEAIAVDPPSSVSNKVAPEKDFFMVTIDKDNKVFLTMDDAMKANLLEEVGKSRNITFSDDDVRAFENADFVGVPLNQLNQFTHLSKDDQAKVVVPGIPYDSTNNELLTWITAAVKVSEGTQNRFLIKADGDSKYPTFRSTVNAFKKNQVFKYNLVTNAEDVPEGSELWKKNIQEMRSGGTSASTD